MATTLYLRLESESSSPITSHTFEDQLATTRGGGVSSQTVTTTASGNHIETPSWWIYRVNAVTISGTITFNFWGLESAMTVNAGLACVISRYDGSGNFVSDVVAQGNANHADGVELGTSAAVMAWTATPTSTSFADGDWIVVKPHVDAVGTMGSGAVDFNYGGSTGGSNGDSFVTFTETIEAYTPADRVPRFTPYPQLLPH